MTERLSRHFALSEFYHDDKAPSAVVRDRLRILAARMELVRLILGARPITITSGWRSAARNAAVGGSPTSDHLTGWACDFRHATMSPRGVWTVLRDHIALAGLEVDQLIGYATHTHLSANPRSRNEAFRL